VLKIVNVTTVNLDNFCPTVVVSDRAVLLSASERVRAASIADSLQQTRFVAAHIALRELVAVAGADIRPGQEFERSKYGKPTLLSGPWFSLSHSRQLAVIAISQNGPVGVDIEQIRPIDLPLDWHTRYPALRRLCGEISHDDQYRFLRAWTRLEAIAKRDDVPFALLIEQSSFQTSGQIQDLDVDNDYLTALACGDDHSVVVSSRC
jgi:4'-phosphopantetheinyl transferase